MKKDTLSYQAHDTGYVNDYDKEKTFAIYEGYKKDDLFGKLGFRKALEKFSHRNMHIDIGCGCGWLLTNTSPLFEKVIGIEPSETAVEVAKEVTENCANVSYIRSDMVDAIKTIDITPPAFFTTATVFSHIKDYYVSEFLKELDAVPDESALFFDERYGTNIQQNLWHIRSKEWWAKQLPAWQLEFFNLENSTYVSGIFGIKVGTSNRTDTYAMTFRERGQWFLEGISTKISRVARAARRIIRK